MSFSVTALCCNKVEEKSEHFFAFSVIFSSTAGKRILVLNGGYRGNEGTLESINEKTFSATIIIETVRTFTQRISKCFKKMP